MNLAFKKLVLKFFPLFFFCVNFGSLKSQDLLLRPQKYRTLTFQGFSEQSEQISPNLAGSVAPLVYYTNSGVQVGILNYYLLPNSYQYFLSYVQKIKNKNLLSTNVNQFRIEDYNETLLSLGYGLIIFPKMSLGLQGNYFRISKRGFTSKDFFSAELSLLMKLNTYFSFLVNFVKSLNSHGRLLNEKLSDNFFSSLNYHTTNFLVFIGLNKSEKEKVKLLAGLKYFFQEKFCLKAGANLSTPMTYFGAGVFFTQNFMIDFTLSWFLNLGALPLFQIKYSF